MSFLLSVNKIFLAIKSPIPPNQRWTECELLSLPSLCLAISYSWSILIIPWTRSNYQQPVINLCCLKRLFLCSVVLSAFIMHRIIFHANALNIAFGRIHLSPWCLKYLYLSHFQDKNSWECEGRGRENSLDWRSRGQGGGGCGQSRGWEDEDEGLCLQTVRRRGHPLSGARGPATGKSPDGQKLGAKVLTRSKVCWMRKRVKSCWLDSL